LITEYPRNKFTSGQNTSIYSCNKSENSNEIPVDLHACEYSTSIDGMQGSDLLTWRPSQQTWRSEVPDDRIVHIWYSTQLALIV